MNAPYFYYKFVRQPLLELYLRQEGVKVITEAKIERITKEGVEIVNKEGKRELIKADHVILAFGRESENKLAKEIEKIGIKPIVIGDAKRPRHIQASIHDANIAARFLIP